MSGLFRCAGDILFDDNQPLPGQISNVQLKKFSETSNFLQYQQPLTPEHPYFFAQIRALSQQSRITLGIAGPDIDNDAHPGHWNNTVGYHSDTGKCFSSHTHIANTKGEKFSIGDMFGVMVTHFGKMMSTVMFLKNGVPVATRYLYEKDQSKFLPTICLQNGPIDLGIMWPEAAMGIPRFDETNMLNWIKDTGVQYDMVKNLFCYNKEHGDVSIQSPVPLTKDMVHFEVVVEEAVGGESPAVGIATCSPLKPEPTCVLLRDFFRWKANGESLKATVGQRIGFGIHYDPNRISQDGFSDKDQQLVLCFVTLNMEIVFFRMMIQPPGGFYPLIILTPGASKVRLDVETNRGLGCESTQQLLDNLYKEKLPDALKVIETDQENTELQSSMFRKSPDIEIDISSESACIVRLPQKVKRIHAIQFNQPLTKASSYFCAEIVKLNEDSVISLGIATCECPLNKHPGKYIPSTGYWSKDGRMYYNDFSAGHFGPNEGRQFSEGDTIGVEITEFNDAGHSVVLFIKNGCPVGTRFLTIEDHTQFLPTISVCGNGYDVELHVYWQNRIGRAPCFAINVLEQWCLPEDALVDGDTVLLKKRAKQASIQCPYRLNEFFNHFEIKMTDAWGSGAGQLPPMLALISACVHKVPSETSRYKLDHIRFWPVEDAEQSLKKGDQVGWGMVIPQSEMDKMPRMVICYLTINRVIVLTRVMFEPPGGLYPLVVAPSNVNRVTFVFTGLHINNHPLTPERCDQILTEAKAIYEEEQEFVKSGKDLDQFRLQPSDFIKTFASIQSQDGKGQTESPKFLDVVVKAKGVDKVMQTYREKKGEQEHSKACVIL